MSDEPKGKSTGQLALMKERIRVFLAAVQAGASDRSAAAEAGISRATVHRWMHGERPFDEAMRNRTMRARAIRERRWLEAIQGAATTPTRQAPAGDWRAAAWLLERTNREFAAPARVELTGQGGAPIQVAHDIEHRLATPDPDRIAKVMQLLIRSGAAPQLESSDGNGNGRTNGTHD